MSKLPHGRVLERLYNCALQTAEAAFFHHSILAQLSFPAQHKLAVYLPFFLPATLPLAIGLQREAKRALRGPLKSAV